MSVLLCIVDGFGYSTKNVNFNPIHSANTPFINSLFEKGFALLEASGAAVGVPDGQVGNSEIGHMTIGSGRIIKQDLIRINEDIQIVDSNVVFCNLIEQSNAIHIFILLSDGGVHSHINHLDSLYRKIVDRDVAVFVHAITDGRDTSPKSAKKYIKRVLDSGMTISTISGRYYAMDRDNNINRTQKYYDAVAGLGGRTFDDPIGYIEESYKNGITDEFILPGYQKKFNGIQDVDGIILGNFRADRIRQIAQVMLDNGHSRIVSMSGCSKELDKNIKVLFPRKKIDGTLSEIISLAGYKQLKIAETEKYAHVTYFLNCGLENAFPMEDRILIESPKVFNYDLAPQMSAYELTDTLIDKMPNYDFACINFANLDMVGHTGNFEAAKVACNVIDQCLNKTCHQLSGVDIFITADHGNIEELFNEDVNQPHTAHTTNPVPIFYFGNKNIILKDGALYDIAPTILKVMGLKSGSKMDGNPLF